MKLEFAVSTFCFGERYYKQTNRLIESFNQLEEIPEIFIITDSPESINKHDFVNVKDIKEYNPKYSNYNTDYYTFDFSVKRFSVLFAFENGYNKVILTDTDAVANVSMFKTETVLNSFVLNAIAGQVTYSFENVINTNAMLGKRFLYYEKHFKTNYDKNLLNEMPEDCIQFIEIDNIKKYKFIDTWNKCIEIKDTQNLANIPAGNIDEICFSALHNDIQCINNSNKSINLLIAHHDKWY